MKEVEVCPRYIPHLHPTQRDPDPSPLHVGPDGPDAGAAGLGRGVAGEGKHA